MHCTALPSTAPTFNKQRGFAPDGRSSGRSDALRCSLSTPDSHSRCLCHHIHQKGLSMISWPIEWFLLNSSFRCGTIPALANIALFILLLFAGLGNTYVNRQSAGVATSRSDWSAGLQSAGVSISTVTISRVNNQQGLQVTGGNDQRWKSDLNSTDTKKGLKIIAPTNSLQISVNN